MSDYEYPLYQNNHLTIVAGNTMRDCQPQVSIWFKKRQDGSNPAAVWMYREQAIRTAWALFKWWVVSGIRER